MVRLKSHRHVDVFNTRIVLEFGPSTAAELNRLGTIWLAKIPQKSFFSKRLPLRNMSGFLSRMWLSKMATMLSSPEATPQECPFRYSLQSASLEINASGSPTRWNGNRCIDYFLCNTFHGTPETPAIALSDRKIQELNLQFSAPVTTSWRLRPCPQLPTYQGGLAGGCV